MQSVTCQCCRRVVRETETCEVCHRNICGNCRDEGSGMCSDCAKAVFRTPEKFLRCCDEDFKGKELANRLKEVDEGDYETERERQEAFEKAQEEIKEHKNDLFERVSKQRPTTSCSDCSSNNIRIYPDFFMGVYRFHCKCIDCGSEWISEQRRL